MDKVEEVRTLTGKIVVNVSDEVCIKFGFLHGNIVITPFGQEATIMGVAPAPRGSKAVGQDVMWFAIKGTTYYHGLGNLKDLGFIQKINNPAKGREEPR